MNEMMLTDDNSLEIQLTGAKQCFSSLNPTTTAEKIAFFNAVNNPTKRLKSAVNTEIKVKDIYAECCEFVNREDGTVTSGVRMVFITDKGESYQAASKGVFTSTQKLLAIMGHPSTWEKPITIIPREISKGANQNVLVFEIK